MLIMVPGMVQIDAVLLRMWLNHVLRNDLKICCYSENRRVKRSEGKLLEFARATRATIIHPSLASARAFLAGAVGWSNSTGEINSYRGISICDFQVDQCVSVPWRAWLKGGAFEYADEQVGAAVGWEAC